jgi:hypothetical protein
MEKEAGRCNGGYAEDGVGAVKEVTGGELS